MKPTLYTGSNGKTHEIATMPFPYLRNLVDKMKREGFHPKDQELFDTLSEERDRREAAYAKEQAALAATGGPA